MANDPIREVVVNGNSYPLEADTSEIEAQLTAEDDLKFQFSKSGTNYGYKDADGNFVPFKNPTGTKSITANGTYDVTDYASAYVNVYEKPVYNVTVSNGAGGVGNVVLYENSNSYVKYMNASYSYNSGMDNNDLFKISYSNYQFTLTAKTTIKRSSYKSMTSPTTMTSGQTYSFAYSTGLSFYVQRA